MKTTVLKIAVLVSGILMLSCGGQKETVTAAEMEKLETLVNEKSFVLNARWANPLSTRSMNAISRAGLLPPGSNTNRIDIIGTASYLKVENDSVMAILPYYGERQFGGAYNPQEVGIQFKGVAENFSMDFNEKKQQYDFEFDVVNEFGEGFNVNGSLYANLNTTFYINSTERMTIGYFGSVETMEAE